MMGFAALNPSLRLLSRFARGRVYKGDAQ